ncbi:heme peroxidase family protein [Streptomyces sp. NPDC059786]|uniref:peroxidase family protein n=1 Tax=Streptomyces sp. NPDC059786 TaxID=3346946 RepID=UPI00364656D8
MQRHNRETFFVVNDGLVHEREGERITSRIPTVAEHQTAFRFSRMSRKEGFPTSEGLRRKLAEAMTSKDQDNPNSKPGIPAGFTYLGQFVDHDLTMDASALMLAFGEPVSLEMMMQGRSPTLDLDSLYGFGPGCSTFRELYDASGRFKTGSTLGVADPAGIPAVNSDQQGFDLPRRGEAGMGTRGEKRRALIADRRNDENLAVAQIHLAFLRFHNRVHSMLAQHGLPTSVLFDSVRETVVKHYQWMLRTDFLPRIVDPEIVEGVFNRGRRFFEPPQGGDPSLATRPEDRPTMPIEFSVAAYRLGHSMVRAAYSWNRVFMLGARKPASLEQLFRFSGGSGNLDSNGDPNDPDSGMNLRLPSSWIPDFRRLFNFEEAGRKDLLVPPEQFNLAQRIDTRLVNPLSVLPVRSIDQRGVPSGLQLNLAFRNFTRAATLKLATGPQLAREMGMEPLSEEQIIMGAEDGTRLDSLTAEERKELVAHTPLWFYILREAETAPRGAGRLTGVGGTIVAEVFHRAMEGSTHSIVKDLHWRPTLPSYQKGTFTMADLLLFAFEDSEELLNPLGDGPLPQQPGTASSTF